MSLNPYKLLLELIPQTPLLIGVVRSIANGIATIDIRGGGVVKARCNDSIKVADNVFIKDNLVEGKAPNLPLSVIEI